MRINVAVPEAQVTKPVLDAALESVTRLNEQLIKSGTAPTFRRALAKNGIRWKPEPPGDEHFDHAGVVQRRNWGDCDDLAPWHAASLRATGEDPDAVAVVRRSGPTRWHAYVERGDGSSDDPSREAGMGKKADGVVGAALPLMYAPGSVCGVDGEDEYLVRPSIAMRPLVDRRVWQARVDLPWHARAHVSEYPEPTQYAMTALNSHAVPTHALVGALEGAAKLGIAAGFSHPDHVRRMAAICDRLEGIPYEEIAACYGDEHAQAAEAFVVGSLWSTVKKGAKGLAKGARTVARTALKVAPAAGRILQFIPGVGPLTREALDFAVKINRAAPEAAGAFAKHFGKGGFPVV